MRPNRRSILTGLSATAAAGLLTAPAAQAAPPVRGGSPWARRAADAWQSLLDHFALDDGSGLLREQVPVGADDPRYSYEWPFSQAHVAAVDLTSIPGSGRRYEQDRRELADAQQHYWTDAGTTGLPGFASAPLPPYAAGGDLFYDDNLWVGLLDVQRYLTTGDRSALREARRISDLVDSGWDTDDSHAAPGGVFWTQAPWSSDRNTVSNMPAAQLDLRLFQITHDHRYLDRALRYLAWTNRHLRREDGLYWDHLDLEGVVEKTIWSYNQGVPVGVHVLLHQVTGERQHLDEACRIAETSLAWFVDGGRLDAHPPFFNSIWFKNLLLLESVTGGRTYRDAMAAYAERVWTTRRDEATGLFVFPDGETGTTTMLLQQAAVVQLFAVLAWRRGDHALLY